MNKMKAISNEIQSIVQSLQSENPISILPRITKIYIQSHLYLAQWKTLEINIDELKNIISVVRRYEANALQLHGKGLWLLSMVLQNTCHKIEFNDFIHTMLFDTLLRIAVEHQVHFVCTAILTSHLDNCNQATAIKLFETGCSIVDTLPEVIPANNFISLLHFALSCISKDKSCALVACKFLVALVPHVLEDYKANFFVTKVTKVLISLLPDSSNSNSSYSTAVLPQRGSDNNNATEELLIEYILILLKYICSLHPHHPLLIATVENDSKILLYKIVIDILCANQHTDVVECAALLCLDTLCIDSKVKEYIKPYITIDLLRLKINPRKPSVTEKASRLFLTLYANELDLNFKSEQFSSNTSSMRSRYTNCISCVQLILDTILEITRSNLQANTYSISTIPTTNTSTQSINKKIFVLGEDDEDEDEDKYYNSSVLCCFDCLNNVIYQMGLSIHVHKIESLHIIISNIISLIIEQFINNPLSSLCIHDANMIDSLFILIGIRERSWIVSSHISSIDIDFNKQSIVLIGHFNEIASSQGLMVPSNNARLSTAMRKTNGFSDDEYETDDDVDSDSTSDEGALEDLSEAVKHSILLNAKNIEYINEKLKNPLFHDFINDFLSQWEVEHITLTSKKILVMYLLIMFHQDTSESFQFSRKDIFQEVIWDLLSDERLGLDCFPRIRRKCIQIFIALMSTDVVGESKPLTNGAILGDYLIKVLSTNQSKRRVLSKMISNEEINSDSNTYLSNIMYDSLINDLQYRYTSLSCLIHVCETERTIRRKVISNYVEISSYFVRFDPIHSMASLLQLLSICSEYLNKAEFEEEEAIVYLLIRALNYSDSCDYYIKIQVCEFIAKIRLVSPGIIHRCLSRKEIEDGLIQLLQSILNKQKSNTLSLTPSRINEDMLRSILKASHALICNANTKPMWIPSPYSYHWSEYNWNISNRPLYGIYFLNCIRSIIKNAHRKYRLQYFCISISILTALMYNCNDGVFVVNNSKLHLHHVTQLKEELISKYLPWLIVALDYLSTHRKVLQSEFNHTKNKAIHNTATTTTTNNNTTTIDKQENLSFNSPEELLAENLIDALYAYLCMDEMFPLSTYLKYAVLFSRTPLIACICYFMTACRDNYQILKKGVDIISHFAHNQIGLSAIGLHAPNALLITATTLHDIMDIQISFCKIVIIVAKSDDSARENLIRFNIQKQLCKLIIKQHSEQSRMACMAMTELCVKNSEVDIICQSLPLVDCVIALLDSLPNDIKIQIEGLRLLIALDQMTDFLVTTKKISFSQVLKRSKIFLTQSLKQNQIPSDYDSNDVDNLLNSSIWNKDKCSIS